MLAGEKTKSNLPLNAKFREKVSDETIYAIRFDEIERDYKRKPRICLVKRRNGFFLSRVALYAASYVDAGFRSQTRG